MLALTSNAVEAIDEILSAGSLPAGAGVRIAPPPSDNGDAPSQLHVTLVALPTESDQVIDERGARVFVDGTVADFLDDKLLDAAVVNEELQFTIAERSE